MNLLELEFGQISHTGMRRSNNQDNLGAVPAANESQFQSQGHLFLIADGMGGHLGGEKASELAVQIVPLSFAKNISLGVASALKIALQEANSTIHRRGQEAIHFYNMGTTCSGLVINKDGAWLGHVGDSRIYRIRHKSIDQLTYDHSFLWETAKFRKVRPEQVKDVMNNKILRCLGPDLIVDVDVEGPHSLRTGDVFLLCSDGLSGPVGDVEIAQASWCLPALDACRFLVALANLRGGPDNISIQIIKLDSTNSTDIGTNHLDLYSWTWLKTERILPWLLLPGLLIGLLFFWMAVKQVKEMIWPSLISAILLTLAGVVGLIIPSLRNGWAKKTKELDLPEGSQRIYRHEKWVLEPDMLENLVKQLESLLQVGEGIISFQSVSLEVRQGIIDSRELLVKKDFTAAFNLLAPLLPKLEPIMKLIYSKHIPQTPIILTRQGFKC